MARYEQLDKDGALVDAFIVDEQTLKEDPTAVITLRAPLKSRAGAAPEGYEHIASVEGDRDALVTDCMVHVYAKKGAYHKEKKSALSGLKAVIADAEARAEGTTTEGTVIK